MGGSKRSERPDSILRHFVPRVRYLDLLSQSQTLTVLSAYFFVHGASHPRRVDLLPSDVVVVSPNVRMAVTGTRMDAIIYMSNSAIMKRGNVKENRHNRSFRPYPLELLVLLGVEEASREEY